MKEKEEEVNEEGRQRGTEGIVTYGNRGSDDSKLEGHGVTDP